MSTTRINYLNAVLMVASCAVAYVVPFELFLIAYAVLGPLHYLTEISWLHKRKYFLPRAYDWTALAVLSVVGGVAIGLLHTGPIAASGNHMTLLAFVVAAILAFAPKARFRIIVMAGLVILLFALGQLPGAVILFLTLLPTLVHVFVFTAAFILLGSLKSRSVSGYLTLVVFAACAVSFFVYRPDSSQYAVSLATIDRYRPFVRMNIDLTRVLGMPPYPLRETFVSDTSIVVMRFIAFAYTYHYLNWFSKTSIIGWHEVSKTRLVVLGVVWLLSVGLYAVDYVLGLQWLFVLSLAHVYLEFPLNHRSFVGIGKELRVRLRPRPVEALESQ